MSEPTPAPAGSPGQEKLVGADRVIAVLVELAQHPQGVSLDELAATLRSPKSTVHRALATLRRAGLADLAARGTYVLGDEFVRLALQHVDGRPETARLQPLLEELAAEFGETAHYAVLSDRDIVYRAKMDPPRGAVRLTSVIGGRNPATRTAVGKALLSHRLLSLDDVRSWVGDDPLQPGTPHTLVTPEALSADLDATRRRGYGLDDQENEIGINCLAIPLFLDGAALPTGAVSISAVQFRTPLGALVEAVPFLRERIAERLGPRALGPNATV